MDSISLAGNDSSSYTIKLSTCQNEQKFAEQREGSLSERRYVGRQDERQVPAGPANEVIGNRLRRPATVDRALSVVIDHDARFRRMCRITPRDLTANKTVSV